MAWKEKPTSKDCNHENRQRTKNIDLEILKREETILGARKMAPFWQGKSRRDQSVKTVIEKEEEKQKRNKNPQNNTTFYFYHKKHILGVSSVQKRKDTEYDFGQHENGFEKNTRG